MYVYFDYRVKTTVDAVTLKEVKCEHCGNAYHYAYRYVGQGHATSAYGLNQQGAADRSRRLAIQNVQSRLHDGVAPVACPKCGKLQPDMLRELKRRMMMGSQALGWVLPTILLGISGGSLLLVSNFFEERISTAWAIGLGIVAAIAIVFCGLCGIRVLLESRTLTCEYFGARDIPVGIAGPAPHDEVSSHIVQKSHSHVV